MFVRQINSTLDAYFHKLPDQHTYNYTDKKCEENKAVLLLDLLKCIKY